MLHYNQWPFYKQHKFNWLCFEQPLIQLTVLPFLLRPLCVQLDQWVTQGGSDPLPLEEEHCSAVEVTEEDIQNSVKFVPSLSAVVSVLRNLPQVQCSCVNQKLWYTSTVLYCEKKQIKLKSIWMSAAPSAFVFSKGALSRRTLPDDITPETNATFVPPGLQTFKCRSGNNMTRRTQARGSPPSWCLNKTAVWSVTACIYFVKSTCLA